MSTRNTLGTGQNNSTYMNSKNKGIIMLLVAAVIVGIIDHVHEATKDYCVHIQG